MAIIFVIKPLRIFLFTLHSLRSAVVQLESAMFLLREAFILFMAHILTVSLRLGHSGQQHPGNRASEICHAVVFLHENAGRQGYRQIGEHRGRYFPKDSEREGLNWSCQESKHQNLTSVQKIARVCLVNDVMYVFVKGDIRDFFF